MSDRPADHPLAEYAADMAEKAHTDSIYRAISDGVVDFRRITYRSRVGDMDIPGVRLPTARHTGPARTRGNDLGARRRTRKLERDRLAFVREAVERGYVVITPEYRGSTGFGAEHHNAIDYGGYRGGRRDDRLRLDVENLPHVESRSGRHDGMEPRRPDHILSITRDGHPFRAGAAIVPVTNLVFRLSYKGPEYQRAFSTQEHIQDSLRA